MPYYCNQIRISFNSKANCFVILWNVYKVKKNGWLKFHVYWVVFALLMNRESLLLKNGKSITLSTCMNVTFFSFFLGTKSLPLFLLYSASSECSSGSNWVNIWNINLQTNHFNQCSAGGCESKARAEGGVACVEFSVCLLMRYNASCSVGSLI